MGRSTRNELARKTQWIKHRERTEAITELIDAGMVETEEEITNTKWNDGLRKRH